MRPARPRLFRLTSVLAIFLAAASTVEAAVLEDPCVPVEGIQDRCPSWESSYGSGPTTSDVASDVVVSPAGDRVIALGTTFTDASGIDGTIAAYDAGSGAQGWVRSLRGPGTTADMPSALAFSPDGARAFVAGTRCVSAPDLPSCDLILTAFEAASGDVAWEAAVDGGDYDSGTDLLVSPDGDVIYVSGVKTSAATGADAALFAFEASEGDLQWQSAYDNARGFDSALFLAISDDGESLFTLGPSSGASRDFATVAYAAETGERQWVARRDDHGGDDLPTGIVAGQGKVIVTGTTATGPQGLIAEYATEAYDARSGEALWTAKYNGGSLDMPLDISLAPDGGAAYVTGMSRGTSSGYDMATAAYDTDDGREIWAVRFNGLANNGDAAWAVEASPRGDEVYVAGDTLVPNVDYLHAVVAYDAKDGSTVWTALHRGGGSRGGSLAQGLDVSPDGTQVFYAGQLLAPTTDSDFLTLAYDAS